MDGGIVCNIFVSTGPTIETIQEILEHYDETFTSPNIHDGLRENIEVFRLIDNSTCEFYLWKDYERIASYRGTGTSYYRGSIHSKIRIKRDNENNRNLYFFFSGKDDARGLSYRLSQLLHVNIDQIDLRGRIILEIARSDASRILRGWWNDLGRGIDSTYLSGILMDADGDNELMQEINERADSISYIQYYSRSLEKTIGLSSRGIVVLYGAESTEEQMVDYYYAHINSRY